GANKLEGIRADLINCVCQAQSVSLSGKLPGEPVAEQTRPRREVLSNIAKIYDPLGVVSPTSLIGKLLYREICDRKKPWDKELPPDLVAKWVLWQNQSRLLLSSDILS
ncbi:Hypothetical predicted protein, partial [Paramuricea clavata]